MLSRLRPKLPMMAVLILAAGLRFWGLGWGLPNALHSYSYHPDEFLLLGAAGSVMASGFPRFYNYPSLYIYLVAFAVASASAYGLAHNMADSYLCARVVTAVMGVAAVWLVYWAAKRLWGPAEALLAALILCIAPLHVQHSHFATVDVPSTVSVAECLGFAGLVVMRGLWRDYALCGVMAGLAAGTKYNAGLVVLSLVAAHFLGSRDRNAGLRRLLAGLGCALVALVISTPGAIAQWPNFVYGLTYEMHHAAQGHGLVFAGTGNGFIYTFTSSLWYGLGPALAILFIVSVIYGLWRLDRKALIILAFALPHYALISLSQVRFARYALPLFPAAALLIAWMACDLWSRFPKGARWAWVSLCAVILCATLLYTVALDRLFVLPDTRDRAVRWIWANVPMGSRIGVVEVPWFYSPPYSRKTGYGTLSDRQEAAASSSYNLDDLDSTSAPPTWAVISDYEVYDALRLRGNSRLSGDEFSQVTSVLRKAEFVYKHYVLRETFAYGLGPFGSTQSLPHDMRYPAPTIWVYERKK